jgi:hypothetical protein
MNLFEISSYLQKIPESPEGTKALMDYANGTSAMVPSYVALAELNRRKLLKDTEAASQQAPQQSLKDQIQNELLGGAAQQMQQLGPGISPQLANPAPEMPQMPQQEMPQEMPQQEMPQQMPQMAEGGLASVPVDMFKRTSFAPGGIVAFNGEDDEQLVKELELYGEDELRGGSGKDRLEDKNPNKPLSNTQSGLKKEIQKAREEDRGIAGIDLGGFKMPEFKERVEPDFNEELAKVKTQKAALGISDDPYAGVRDLRNQLEKMQESRRENESSDRLMALFSGEHPSGNFFAKLGAGADKAQQLKGLQQAQREKDLERKMEYTKLDIQEDQARRKGDLDAVKAAMADKQRLEREDRQDRTTFGNMQASIMNGQASLSNADVQQRQERRASEMTGLNRQEIEARIRASDAQARQAGRPTDAQFRLNLLKTDPVAYERLYGEDLATKAVNSLSKEESYKYASPDQQYQMIVDRIELLKRLARGEAPPAGPAPAAAKPGLWSSIKESIGYNSGPSLPPGLPAGARQVGTSGGKPVYEYVGQDGKTKRVIQGN